MRSLIIVFLLFVEFGFLCAFNIETAVISDFYLRDGGKMEPNSTLSPAYSGYSFDIDSKTDHMRIVFGQPHSGLGEEQDTETTGSIYTCNFTYMDSSPDSVTIDPTYSTAEMTRSVEEVTTASTLTIPESASYFSTPDCREVNVVKDVGTDHITNADALGLAIEQENNGDNYTICTPLRQRVCRNGKSFVPGACYVGEPNTDTWKQKTWEEIECFDQKIEIIFVVDGSQSIGEGNFNLVRQWLIDVANSTLQVFGSLVQMEVLQYGNYDIPALGISIEDSTKFKIPFKLGECSTIDCMAEKILAMPYIRQQTYTYYGLRRALEVEFPQSPWFDESKKVVIVLTDGDANDGDKLHKWYPSSLSLNITTFAIGVGAYDQAELRLIANGGVSDERVFTVSDFNLLQGVIITLTNEIKTTTLEGSGSTTTSTNEVTNAQFGSSIASSASGKLFFGAVGAYDWSGTVIKYDSVDDETADIPEYSDIQSVLPTRTKESYLGYSITTGFFDGNATEYVATSAPRYFLTGAVVIYTTRANSSQLYDSVTLRAPLSKRQFGSGYGGSLLAVDVTGDGKDELFVGVPLYVGDKFDEGRVFVYIGQSSNSLQTWKLDSYEPLELYGHRMEGGRFGTTMASAGDLNMDGYNDVIVGAPLTETDRGAVFVYHGNKNGMNTEAKQKILESELLGVSLKYFGQSLQGGVDLDGNKYPDIAVGAPKSDTVVIFRSRPVVTIQAELSYKTSEIDIFECINKDYINCSSVEVCFTASGVSVESSIGLRYNLTLDANKIAIVDKRLEFRSQPNVATTGMPTISQDIQIQRDVKECFRESMYMKANIKDYDLPVTAEVKFDLLSSHTSVPLSSVRDPDELNIKTSENKFAKRCGTDRTCESDLHIDAELILPPFEISSNDLTEGRTVLIVDASTANIPVVVKVNLTNTGENAFDTKIRVTYTSQISLSTLLNRVAYPPTDSCMVEDTDPVNVGNGLRAQIFRYNYQTNIMRPNSWCYFEFNLITDNLRNNGTIESIFVNITAYASDSSNASSELNPDDNTWQTSPLTKYRSDFINTRKSGQAEVSFNYTTKNETITSVTEIGRNTPDVVMEYEIVGLGYSNIPLSQMSLTWLSRDNKGSDLLYLYQIECTSKTGVECSCEQEKINHYNLTLEAPNVNNTEGPNVTVIPSQEPVDQRLVDCYNQSSAANRSCETIKCNVTNLGVSDRVTFIGRFRVWTPSIMFNETDLSQLELLSRFSVSTELSPLVINSEGSAVTIKTEDVVTKIKKYVKPQTVEPPVDETWIYIVSAVGGLLLLIIIVVVLWQCGFFESKYADLTQKEKDDLEDETEFQPHEKEQIKDADVNSEVEDEIN